VFYTPVFNLGGVEHWITKIFEKGKNNWDCVVAVSIPVNIDPIQLADAEKHATVVRGGSACEQVCRDADLVICWSRDRSALKNRIGPTVFVSHLADEMGRSATESWRPNDATWMAVSEPAATVCPGKAKVIRHGIDSDRMDITSSLTLTVKKPVLGYVGRFDLAKNYLMPAKVARLMEYDIIYLGKGLKGGEVAELKKIYPKVTVLEPRLACGDVYRSIDVLISASFSETGPLTVLEAMYCGTRVVATPIGILPELEQEHGKMYEQTPLYSHETWIADAVNLALADNKTYLHAQEIIKANYLLKQSVEKWILAFSCIMG